MTVSNDPFDRLHRIVEQLAEAQFQGKTQHDQEMIELRQLQVSNARAIEAGKNQHDHEMSEIRQLQASNAKAIEALGSRVTEVAGQVAEVSSGVDAAFRTIESMNRVAESLETTQIEMRQQHHEQMDRLGNVLELLLTRYPMPPQAG